MNNYCVCSMTLLELSDANQMTPDSKIFIHTCHIYGKERTIFVSRARLTTAGRRIQIILNLLISTKALKLFS